MDERGEEEHRLVGGAGSDILHAAVADPLRRMILRRELGDLGHIVHLAAHPVHIEDPGVFAADIGHILVAPGGYLLLRMTPLKAHRAVGVPEVVHLPDAAAAIALRRDAGVEALSGIRPVGVVVVAAGARGVLPRQQRQPRRDADRGGGDTLAEYHRIPRERIEVRGLYPRVAEGGYGVVALLVCKQDKNMLHLYSFSPAPEKKLSLLSVRFRNESKILWFIIYRLIIISFSPKVK